MAKKEHPTNSVYDGSFALGAVIIAVSIRELLTWAASKLTWWGQAISLLPDAPSIVVWSSIPALILFAVGCFMCQEGITSLFSISGSRQARMGAVSSAVIFSGLIVTMMGYLTKEDGIQSTERKFFLVILGATLAFLILYTILAKRDSIPKIVYANLGEGENNLFQWRFGANLYIKPAIDVSTSEHILKMVEAVQFHMDEHTELEKSYNALSLMLPGLQSALAPERYAKMRVVFAEYLLNQRDDIRSHYRSMLSKHCIECAGEAGIKSTKIGLLQSSDENMGYGKKPLNIKIFVQIVLSQKIKNKLAVSDDAQSKAIVGSTESWVGEIRRIFNGLISGQLTPKEVETAQDEFIALSNRISESDADDVIEESAQDRLLPRPEEQAEVNHDMKTQNSRPGMQMRK